MSLFDCKSCLNHQQELREMRLAHEAEKEKMRVDFNAREVRKDEMISSLHDRLMSRDIQDLESAKNPNPISEKPREEDPYVSLEDVPNIETAEGLKEALNNA